MTISVNIKLSIQLTDAVHRLHPRLNGGWAPLSEISRPLFLTMISFKNIYGQHLRSL